MPKKKELIFISDIFDLVFHPQRGIAAINKKGRLVYAFFIVLLAGFLHGALVFLRGAVTTPLAQHIKTYALVYIPIVTIALWLIFSLGLHLGAKFLKIKSSYTKVLIMLGYILSTFNIILAFLIALPLKFLLVDIGRIPLGIAGQVATFLDTLFLIYLAILILLGLKEINQISFLKGLVILFLGIILYPVVLLGLAVPITVLGLALLGR